MRVVWPRRNSFRRQRNPRQIILLLSRFSNQKDSPDRSHPPHLLAKYNEAFEGCAERIVAMTETQARHRQDLEKKVVFSNSRHELFGQISALIIAMSASGHISHPSRKDSRRSGCNSGHVSLAGRSLYLRKTRSKKRARREESYAERVDLRRLGNAEKSSGERGQLRFRQ